MRTSILTASTTPAPHPARRVTPQNRWSQRSHKDFAETLLVAIVASTPYAGDDIMNKDIRVAVNESGKTLVGFTWDWVVAWMVYDGRFFPGSLSWTYALFWFFDSPVTYKLAIGFILVASIAAFGHLVSRFTGHWQTGAMLVPIVLGLIQFRVAHDGIVSYAGLLPLTAGLCAVAMVILISRRGPW